MKESDIQRQILDYLRAMHIFAWRNNTGAAKMGGRYVRFGLPGAGDIIGILPGGRFLSVEVKAPGSTTAKKRAEAQGQFRRAINESGGLAIEARSVEEVMEALRG